MLPDKMATILMITALVASFAHVVLLITSVRARLLFIEYCLALAEFLTGLSKDMRRLKRKERMETGLHYVG